MQWRVPDLRLRQLAPLTFCAWQLGARSSNKVCGGLPSRIGQPVAASFLPGLPLPRPSILAVVDPALRLPLTQPLHAIPWFPTGERLSYPCKPCSLSARSSLSPSLVIRLWGRSRLLSRPCPGLPGCLHSCPIILGRSPVRPTTVATEALLPHIDTSTAKLDLHSCLLWVIKWRGTLTASVAFDVRYRGSPVICQERGGFNPFLWHKPSPGNHKVRPASQSVREGSLDFIGFHIKLSLSQSLSFCVC